MKPLFEQKWYNKPRKERRRKKYQVSELDAMEAEIQRQTSKMVFCSDRLEEQVIDTLRRMSWDDIKEQVRIISERLFEKVDKAPKAHGFMMYHCEDCGQMFRVYLEEGIEQYKMYPNGNDTFLYKVKPSPFMIKCPYCKDGLAQDMYCHVFPLGYYKPLITSGEFYFANIEGEECGKFRIVGEENATAVS